MNPITSYDLVFALANDATADATTIEARLAELRKQEAEHQKSLEEENEARAARKTERQVSELANIVGFAIAYSELVHRSAEQLPPTTLITPMRKLHELGIILPGIAAFGDARAVEAELSRLFESWPDVYSNFAAKVHKAASKWASRLNKLIDGLPSECLINGALKGSEKPMRAKTRTKQPKEKSRSFTLEDRARVQQQGKDFRKDLLRVVGQELSLASFKDKSHSRLGDYEALNKFEQEWKLNITDGDKLQVVLPDLFARLADLLVSARPHLAAHQIMRFASKLIAIRQEIPVPLAPDAYALWTLLRKEEI